MNATWNVPHVDRLTASNAAARSWWLLDALTHEPNDTNEPLTSDVRADVCVVGGGFTGLWTAIELKQRDPSIEVTVLEATLCGAGASGTNAGMLMNLWPKLPALLRAGGESDGPAVARASVEAIEHVVKFCADHHIDAQITRNGWLWAANNSTQDGAWDSTLDIASAYPGSPFTTVDTDTASDLAGAPVRGGVFDSKCVGLQPARLVRGLLRVARELGVVVHEHSPMTALETTTGRTRVRSVHSSVEATKVVLAINAWCNQFAQVRPHLVMTASDNAVLRPRHLLSPSPTTNVSDSGRLLDYWRSLPDGNILFGKAGVGLGWGVRGASSQFTPAPRPRRLTEQIVRTVPGLKGADVISTWRAPVEYSLSSLPFFGTLAGFPGVIFGTGYSGDGIGPSVLGAQVLATLVNDSNDGLASTFLTRPPTGRGLPPEPIRFLGGQMVEGALLRRDRIEDAERRIDLPTKLLSAIDPTSFVG